MRCISIANQKGGVGKTTTIINLGAALVELGERVLMIDIDPQGALAAGLGIDPRKCRILYHAISGESQISSLILETPYGHLIPNNPEWGGSPTKNALLSLPEDIDLWLLKQIENHLSSYDYILFDHPPLFGILDVNAFIAADSVIIPVQPTFLALRGLEEFVRTIEDEIRILNPDFQIEGILPTMVEPRTRQAQEAEALLRKRFGDLVFESKIRKAVSVSDAQLAGLPILAYQPTGTAASDYRALAKELLNHETPHDG